MAPRAVAVAYVGETRVPLEDLFRLHHKAGSFVVDFHVEFNLLGWRSMRRLATSADQSMPVPYPDDPDLGGFYRTEMGNLTCGSGAPRCCRSADGRRWHGAWRPDASLEASAAARVSAQGVSRRWQVSGRLSAVPPCPQVVGRCHTVHRA